MWMRWVVVIAIGCGGARAPVSETPSDPAPAPPRDLPRMELASAPRVAVDPPLAFDGDVAVVSVDHWMWCFATPERIDMCTSTREQCAKWSTDMHGFGCAPAPEMACFHVRGPGDSRDFGMCYRAVEHCKQAMLVWGTGSNDPITMGCAILRYAAPAHP